jgi:hypothetical protein
VLKKKVLCTIFGCGDAVDASVHSIKLLVEPRKNKNANENELDCLRQK